MDKPTCEHDEGQARTNMLMFATSNIISSHVVLAGPDLEHMNLEASDTSLQPNPEQMDEEFTTTAYPMLRARIPLNFQLKVSKTEETASSDWNLSLLSILGQGTQLHQLVPCGEMLLTELFKLHSGIDSEISAKSCRKRDPSPPHTPKLIWLKQRKKKKRRHDSSETPPGSPPHQPPPPPPPAAINEKLIQLILALDGILVQDSSRLSYQFLKELHMDDDTTHDEQEQLGILLLCPSIALTLENLLLAQTGDMAIFMDWFCKMQGITELKQQDLEGPTYEIVKVFHPNVSQELDKNLNCQLLKMEGSLLSDVGARKFVPIDVDLKRMKYDIVLLLHEDDRLRHLNHLPPEDKKILTTAVNLWTRNLVIRQRVEDFQLGIESYQTQLNLTKPRWMDNGFSSS
ncbi:hypothetical protein Tco_0801903 [Tanacetum coccineum]|uniref:Uncharacterized protein n=1 Tax=Tanacetum coccineum TaxID=301880 RepID=A0ABQ4ZX96_9ASTR